MTRRTGIAALVVTVALGAAGAVLIATLLDGCLGGLQTRGSGRWIREQTSRLVAFRPTADTIPARMELFPEHGLIKVRAWEGYVPLGEKEWVFFTSCSSERTWPADVVLAIDQAGHLYACNAHVCPILMLSWPVASMPNPPRTAAEFFSGEVYVGDGHDGSNRWVNVDRWR